MPAVGARYPDRYFALCVIAREEVRRRYEQAGIALFEDPWRAVEAVAAAMRCAERLAAPRPTPRPPLEGLPHLPARRIGEYEAKRILVAAGIPVVDERLARSPAETAAAARHWAIGWSSRSSRPISRTRPRYAAYSSTCRPARQQAPISGWSPVGRTFVCAERGVLISPMLRDGVETIIGVQNDPVFGPVVMFGLGGIFVEVLGDVAFRMAPFGPVEARHMIGEIKGSPVLEGARGSPPADAEALAEALARLSQAAATWRGQFTSIEINPLLVRPRGAGVVALDALILTPDRQGSKPARVDTLSTGKCVFGPENGPDDCFPMRFRQAGQ